MDIWSAASRYMNRYVITGGILVLSVSCYKWLDSNKRWKQSYYSKAWFRELGERTDTTHRDKKRALFEKCELEGDIVEIGTADGYNLNYYLEYANEITSLTCIEPSKEFFQALKPKVENFPFPVMLFNSTFEEFVANSRHENDLEDKFDVIISILVLCSVDNPVGVITDSHAMLKQGGRLALLEHRRSKSYFKLFIQYLFNPIWRLIKNDCRLNRDTYSDIGCVQWKEVDVEFHESRKFLIGEYYSGVAVK